MVNESIVRELALSFPEVTESAHFEKPSFRVRNKIFATLDQKSMNTDLIKQKKARICGHFFVSCKII